MANTLGELADFQRQTAHRGQTRLRLGALMQLQQTIAPGLGVVVALQRRRGRAEHDGHPGLMGAKHRHIPRRIAQAILLLERAVVLLIHHDQPQLRQFGKHRQPRAQHDARLTALRLLPMLPALAIRQTTVQTNQRGIGEALLKITFQLRREVDFRYQQQHLLPTLQGMLHEVDIHLGLAAAGNAVQQKTGVAAASGHGIAHGLLRRGQGVGIAQRRNGGSGGTGARDADD